MLQLIQAIPFSYAAIFPVLNPIGSAVIFISLTRGLTRKELNRLVLKVSINTAILLLVVLFAGSWILRFFGITIPIVQIGGGLVVAYIGWVLLNQPSDPPEDTPAQIKPEDKKKIVDGMAFFPLTMPITAGPGSIAVTLTIGAHNLVKASWENSTMSLIGSTIGILLGAITVYFCYKYTNYITNRLRPAGTQVIMRLSAFINLCIGLEIIWHGISSLIP